MDGVRGAPIGRAGGPGDQAGNGINRHAGRRATAQTECQRVEWIRIIRRHRQQERLARIDADA